MAPQQHALDADRENVPGALDAADRLRERALALARSGAILGPTEMAAIFRIGSSRFYVRRALGDFDQFRIKGVVGPKQYSGTLVARAIDGEPASVFGRKRA